VPGGKGGGTISLTVGGVLTVDGEISADGTNGGTGNVYLAYWSGGGGSGGSINLRVGTIRGAGSITAQGGNGGWSNRSGGGAGGRISLLYDHYDFDGNISVRGGIGKQKDSTGTVYSTSEVRIDESVFGLLHERVFNNQQDLFVYKNADSFFNHGFPSGFFGQVQRISIDAACVDDPRVPQGCSEDVTRLDRKRGNVFRFSIAPLLEGEFAGLNFEEPENYGISRIGNGYDVTDVPYLAGQKNLLAQKSVGFRNKMPLWA